MTQVNQDIKECVSGLMGSLYDIVATKEAKMIYDKGKDNPRCEHDWVEETMHNYEEPHLKSLIEFWRCNKCGEQRFQTNKPNKT